MRCGSLGSLPGPAVWVPGSGFACLRPPCVGLVPALRSCPALGPCRVLLSVAWVFWFLPSGFLGRLCFSLFLCLASVALSLLRRSLVSRASWPLFRLLVFEPLFSRCVLRAPLSPRTGAFRTWIFVLLATLGCECPCRIRFSISLLSASLAPCVRFRFSPLKCCPHALNEACSCFSFWIFHWIEPFIERSPPLRESCLHPRCPSLDRFFCGYRIAKDSSG